MTRVLVFGAGIIGQVYGGRLAQAGHDVTLLAHGETLEMLRDRGVALRTAGAISHTAVRVVDSPRGEPVPDVVLVTVRRDQIKDALPAIAELSAGRIVFLLNLPGGLEVIRERVGAHRTIFAFPGVGGRRGGDGTIDYVEVPQQKTTVERRGLEAPIVELLESAGFPVEMTSDMAGWLETHAVFVTAISAAILACGGDSVALADDPEQLGAMVAAVREGFRALDRNGVSVTPTPLRLLFTTVPRFAAVRYWSKQLRGPLGTVAIAPHVRASRETELPILCADVRRLVAGAGPLPHLERMLEVVAAAPPVAA
jgi:2-dehydropantoate 2-reductase